MKRPSQLPARTRDVFSLARHDREAARAALRALSTEAQVDLVIETPIARRGELLDLVPDVARVVPALPEAELVFTLKAIGLGDAGWLIEHATPEQLRACIDLDAWRGLTPDRRALHAWLTAIGDSEDAQIRAFQELDPELLVLFLREQAEVHLQPDREWSPPDGAMTVDGQFWLVPIGDSDDLERLMEGLRLLFERDYWLYFRLLQGAIHELDSDCEEFALRWRTGRLADLGFPDWNESIAIYARIDGDRLFDVPAAARALEIGNLAIPIDLPPPVLDADSAHLVFRTAAELSPDERRVFFHRFVTLANQIAVADRLPLGDAESIPRAIEKAARVISLGLERIARERALAPIDLLRRVELKRLFAVGASLDPSVRPPVASET